MRTGRRPSGPGLLGAGMESRAGRMVFTGKPAGGARLVERGNGVQGGLYGLTRELVTEHEHADAFVGRPISADRFLHARDGIGLAECRPVFGAPADLRALLVRIREP